MTIYDAIISGVILGMLGPAIFIGFMIIEFIVSRLALKKEGEYLANLNGPPIEELRKRVKIVPRTTIIEGAGEGEP